jgi:6-phosphogluconolactonase (cycloisomerase 2 family)
MNPTFAYIGCRTTKARNARGKGLSVYRVDQPGGAWALAQCVEGLVNPSYLAFDRDRRVLYAVHGDHAEVSAFRIDAHDGTLKFINQQSTYGLNPVHLAVDPSNRFLVVANYATGSVAALAVRQDGGLDPVCDLLLLPGKTGPHREGQSFSHPHQILLSPDESGFIVPDKGLDATFVVEIDSDRGKLRLNEARTSVARPGAGPRHAVFHPAAPILYVLNELDSTVTTCRYDRATQTISALEVVTTQPANFFGSNTGAAIEILPSGRFVYVSNRGHDSVAIFAVDPVSYRLKEAGRALSAGKVPRCIALDPSGQTLFVANEGSDTIVLFQVDQESGALKQTGQVLETGSPVCILFNAASV